MEENMEHKLPEFKIKISHEAKLRELLRNLTSTESQLCYDASKEFVKVIKSDLGPEFLREYVQSSSQLVEISQVWEFFKGKPGFLHILNLVAAILKLGKDNVVNGGGFEIVKALDKFARVVIEERMADLYKELNSKDAKRQKTVLSVLASIVRFSPQLAWEVAKLFDFKLACLPKLSEVRLRKKNFVEHGRKSFSTRKAFVGFAMSFLEVGSPRLMRGILQQKEMYGGVLRGLGNDDQETVVYVLSILRDKVLVPESFIPPGLRSVLFGSITLENLAGISRRDNSENAAKLAHNLLVMVCTDPVNGLMPDLERLPSPLRGNPKRLLDLMKKLKPTEFGNHKDLLLAIVKGRPLFGSLYLDEFPYRLEDPASENWFAAISLAADIVSSVACGLQFGLFEKAPAFDSQHVQDIMKCIRARPFTRLVINKGLLHSNSLVKHGTLRLVLEELNLLDSLMKSVDSSSRLNCQMMHYWKTLKADVQNAARVWLPDPQVLLSLLSPLNNHFKNFGSTKKRMAEIDSSSEHCVNLNKRLKRSDAREDLDILISGINPEIELSSEDGLAGSGGKQTSSNGATFEKSIRNLWGLHGCSRMHMELQFEDSYFYSKILDSLKIYYCFYLVKLLELNTSNDAMHIGSLRKRPLCIITRRTMPTSMEGVDLFKLVGYNPLVLPAIVQQSLLELLNKHVKQFSNDANLIRSPPQMYKHLYPFVILLLGSPVRQIKEQAYTLAKAAILSTGAFDNNTKEICTWFLFIPGYSRDRVYVDLEVQIFQRLSSVIVSFLCEAVSTTGNNLFKYMELLKHYVYDAESDAEMSPDLGPFSICVLEKCLRLLRSDNGSFTIPQKSSISLYVCNTMKYLVETQVNARQLSFLIDRVLSENSSSIPDVLELDRCPCEWRPIKTLLHFARDILHRQCYGIYSNVDEDMQSNNSLTNTLTEVAEVMRSEYDTVLVGLTVGFNLSLICTRKAELLQNFPFVLSISSNLLEVPSTVLPLIFFLEPDYLTDISKLWPEVFWTALDKVIDCQEKKENNFSEVGLYSMESASAAFARYLEGSPFPLLFSSIMECSKLHLLEHSAIQKLLLAKVSEMSSDHLVSSLCNVLFWINHTRLQSGGRSLDEVEMLSDICNAVAKQLLNQLLVEVDSISPTHVKAPLPLNYAAEVAEILFNHPAVTAIFECPLSSINSISESMFGENLEKLLESTKLFFHKMDLLVLDLIGKASDLLCSMFDYHEVPGEVTMSRKRVSRAFEMLKQKLFLAFKKRFDTCSQSLDFKSLVPSLCALHSLIRFISPIELLELVNWLCSQIDLESSTFHISSKRFALYIALHLARCTFSSLSANMAKPCTEIKFYTSPGRTYETDVDVLLFERIFFHVLEVGCCLRVDIADTCLLKAFEVVNMHKVVQRHYLPSIMVLSRVTASTHADIFSYCLDGINRIKTDLLYLITRMSPLHMSVFGFIFSAVLEKSSLPDSNARRGMSKHSFSDEELLMLLPTVFMYLNSTIPKYGKGLRRPVERVLSVYGHILFGGFSKWKIFTSQIIFDVGLDEPLTASPEEFLKIFSDSLLGKAILMVQNHLASNENLVKLERRLSLFKIACPSSEEDIFDNWCAETGLQSVKQPMQFVNRVIAKINFCRMLLFSWYNDDQLDNGDKQVISPQVASEMEKSRVQFMRMLINSWILIVKKFPENGDCIRHTDSQNHPLFRFLEVFVMKNLLELTTVMYVCLTKLDSLPFIEQLVKSFLLYRFGDPETMKMLQALLSSISQGNFSCTTLLHLVLAHSQFAQSINLASQSRIQPQLGLVFSPMRSVFKAFVKSHADPESEDQKNNIASQPHLNLLELVKLVRVLFHIYVEQRKVHDGEDNSINSKELVYLLLSCYGATCNKVDLEIYNLILEIEANDKSCAGSVARMGYLWGIASLKVRNDWEPDKDMQSVEPKKVQELEEYRKLIFRENLPVDPKLCAQTVLYFPFTRSVNGGAYGRFQKDSSAVMDEDPSTSAKLEIYDPAFILRFSIHCLATGYIEPIEFASLGLLAITFVSISSPDVDIRKLGYESLVKFKGALEKYKKKKDVARLRLLVTYLQNGIGELWQRIPSIIAAFTAEASLVLLDPSHDNYSRISKHLMKSPGVNMRAIPLFQNFFWSSSINSRADRVWMLQLLYLGLNTEDDALIYIRNSVFEILQSFYSSPFSDGDSKELAIQILKKAAQLHKAVRYLVEQCGLMLWLPSVFSSLYMSEYNDQNRFALRQLPIVLEVVNYITSSRNIIDWLQSHAMEHFSELAMHLYKLLVNGVELIKEQSILCNSILKTLTLVLKISQKRKVYQPHFTLSEEGLFQLYQAVEVCSSKESCNLSSVLALKAVLMSIPITLAGMGQEKLVKFLTWAITTAAQSVSTEVPQPEDSGAEESLASKFLRWLTASVIIGKTSSKLRRPGNGDSVETSTVYTLQSLLEYHEKKGETEADGCEDGLAASLLYLLQLLHINYRLLPSAVSALCLLLLPLPSSELELSVSNRISLSSLSSRIRCPAEANPTWRWTYYQPWKDLSMEQSEAEKLDEINACERLMMVASNILQKKSGCSHFFDLQDVESLRVYEWQTSRIQS